MTATNSNYRIDGAGNGEEVTEHPPELYNPETSARTLPGLDAVDDDALAFYREHGWITVANVFSLERVQNAMDAIDDLIAGRNPDFNGVYYEAAAKAGIDHADAKARLDKVRKLAWYSKYDTRLEEMAQDEVMLSIVRRLLGDREPRLFQDMALLKPPKIGREKPWHQDHAYFDLRLEERVVGVWIALDRATVANGCMQFLDRGHQTGPMLHWRRRDWQICDTDMAGRRSVAAPLEPGGALFFDSLLPHGTPKNNSPDRRRALQFHYAAADAEKIPQEQRLAVFGTEGKDVSC